MIHSIDALLPSEMASKAETLGVNKVNYPVSKLVVLAILAGAFIALGAVFFVTVTSGNEISYGLTRLLGGVCFSLGLILVIIGGAELFTGNNLIVMAWANKKITTFQLLRNWCLVFIGNSIGAVFIAVLMLVSKQYLAFSGEVGINLLNIAKVKCELGFIQALASGILCNILVCLAVWLCFSSTSVTGKIFSIIFPVAAFVANGFEHSIANMYFIPKAIWLLQQQDPMIVSLIEKSGQQYGSINWSNFIVNNLIPVTLGNIIGGAVLVGMVYWFVYLRKSQ